MIVRELAEPGRQTIFIHFESDLKIASGCNNLKKKVQCNIF